jgi:putative ABC transport system permease protein
VRGVLLKPLVNRDENRLIYIRQSAPGIGDNNSTFSVPEIQDLRASVKTLSEFGDFSTFGFTMIGLGEPRQVQAGVVGGNYFDVIGPHPVLGRLIGPLDDGPKAAGVVVLTFVSGPRLLGEIPALSGKTVRLQKIQRCIHKSPVTIVETGGSDRRIYLLYECAEWFRLHLHPPPSLIQAPGQLPSRTQGSL